MGFFYNPPPRPPTSSATGNSGTPPYNEVQDGSASQPPFRQVQAALAMAVVLGAWPASGEPRLQAPNNQQVKIAPLTLAYGDQPATVGPITPSEYAQVRLTWENPWSAQSAPKAIPPPLPVPPPVVGPLTPTELLIQQSWPQGWSEPQRLTTLVQTTGDQPSPQAPLTATEESIFGQWPIGWTLAQGPPKNAATIPPPIVQTVQPYVRPFMGQPLVPWVQPPTLADTAPLTCQAVGLPAHDEFQVNYSTSLGPCNWTQTAGQFGTDGLGHALGLNSGSNLAFWKETAFSPDQYCQVTVSTYGFDDPAPCVRVSPSGNDSYAMVADQASSNITLYQTIAGVGTPIQSVGSITCSDGDVLKLQVVGSTLKMFVNSVQIGTDQVDTGITTGQPGLFLNRTGATRTLLDNFVADNLAPPPSTTIPFRPTGSIDPGIWASVEPPITWRLPQTLLDTAPLTCQFVGLPAHDDFGVNYSTSLGPCNWTQTAGQFGTDGLGHAYAINTGLTLALWKETAFSPDQYSQLTINAYGDDSVGPAVRISPTGDASYAIIATQGTADIRLYRTVAGVGTLIQTVSSLPLAASDLIKLQVTGTTIRMFLNGTQVGTDQIDTFVTTGQPGIFISRTVGAPATIDSFIADQVGAPTPTVGFRPTGWINAGIWASAFAPEQIEVVTSNVVVSGTVADQPPRIGPISTQTLTIRQAWTTDWPAQTGPKVAAWFVPPVVNTPPPHGALSVTEQLIVQSWPTGWNEPQRLTVIAPPTPFAPPTPHGPISVATTTTIGAQWVQTWNAQRGSANYTPPFIPPAFNGRVVYLLTYVGDTSVTTFASTNTFVTYAGDASVLTYTTVTNSLLTYPGDTTVTTTDS